MTQEDKLLLLKDLCARLPYNVKGKITADYVIPHKYDNEGFPLESTFDVDVELNGINIDTEEISISIFENKGDLNDYIDECQSDNPWTIEEFTPYLRPMSSMTEGEKRHISKMMCLRTYDNGVVHDMNYPVYTPYYVMDDCLSYLRSIHVDYSGLIEKGLALEATKGLYKIN